MGANWRKNRQSLQGLKSFVYEFDSSYIVNNKGGTNEVAKVHGGIVNQLADELRGFGYDISNSPVTDGLRPDIEICGPTPGLIEVKGGKRWSDIYCCIGQLFSYGRKISPDKQIPMIAVFPSRTEKAKIQTLRDMDIEVVQWQRKKRNGGFHIFGLESALIRSC